MTALTFTVFSVAQPQGSARAFMPKGARYPVVTSDNPKLKDWRRVVADGASRALNELPAAERGLLEGPVRLLAAFHLPRPKSLGKKSCAHTTRPDVDKLSRSLGDALSGVVYRDDAQIVQLKVTKAYAAPGASPCAVISVTSVPEGVRDGSAASLQGPQGRALLRSDRPRD